MRLPTSKNKKSRPKGRLNVLKQKLAPWGVSKGVANNYSAASQVVSAAAQLSTQAESLQQGRVSTTSVATVSSTAIVSASAFLSLPPQEKRDTLKATARKRTNFFISF